MRRVVVGLGVLAGCLAFSACGPLLDHYDSMTGRVGPHTPTGTWKRDFWGRSYFEQRSPPEPKEQTDRSAAPAPDKAGMSGP